MKTFLLLLIPLNIFCQSREINQYKEFISTMPSYKKSIINSNQEEWTSVSHKETLLLNPNCKEIHETIYDSIKTNVVIYKNYICDSLTETTRTVYLPNEITEYDGKNNVVSKSTYNSKNNLWTTVEKRSYGNFKYIHINDSINRTDEEYKDGKLLIKRVYYGIPQDSCLQFDPQNKLVYKTIYRYDKFKNIEYLEDYSYMGNKPDLYVTNISYTYDKHNNWTEKTEVKHHYPPYPLDEKLNPPIETKIYKRELEY